MRAATRGRRVTLRASVDVHRGARAAPSVTLSFRSFSVYGLFRRAGRYASRSHASVSHRRSRFSPFESVVLLRPRARGNQVSRARSRSIFFGVSHRLEGDTRRNCACRNRARARSEDKEIRGAAITRDYDRSIGGTGGLPTVVGDRAIRSGPTTDAERPSPANTGNSGMLPVGGGIVRTECALRARRSRRV